MKIKLHWSTKAVRDLDKIYSYYSKKSEKSAIELYNAILDAIELLCSFPEMAPLEPLLENNLKPYRGLTVKKHFKIIYYIENNLIHIAVIWDCRQSTKRLKQLFNH